MLIYLENGVRAVWLVFPERQEVTVHFPDQPVRIVSGDMQLDGGQVLPGFAVSMREIFGDNPGGIPDCQLIASRLLLRSSPSS